MSVTKEEKAELVKFGDETEFYKYWKEGGRSAFVVTFHQKLDEYEALEAIFNAGFDAAIAILTTQDK